MDKLKETLLKYVDRGLYLFPVKVETKRPAIKDNLNQASNDIDQLMEWAEKFPNCNWAISLAKSGCVAVDVDHKYGGMEAWEALIEKHGEPEALKAISGSGGLHYVFRADKSKRYRGKIQSGIDVKFNGYVLVYPSKHERTGRHYRWDPKSWKSYSRTRVEAPSWLKELIEKDARVGKADPTYKFGSGYLDKLVKLLKEYELDYEEWMQAGMALHAATEGSSEGLQLYLELTQGESYEDGDLEQAEAKWDSFSDRGDGISQLTLGFLIRKKGGVVPSPGYEDDIRAFKEAKIAKIESEKEEANDSFVIRGENFVCWSKPGIVDWFNNENFAYFSGDPKAPYMKVAETKNGPLSIKTMGEKALKDQTEPYFLIEHKDTGTDVKLVLSPAYKVWTASRRRRVYHSVVFKDPDKTAEGELNLFSGLPLKPVFNATPTLALDFIEKSLCAGDSEKYNWLLDWLAHLIQKPFERSSVVPVLISEQGAGKGLLMDEIMKGILGGYYTAVNTAKELMAQFNIKLSRKLLTFIDEATWRGNKTEDGILKRMTASPTMTVEEKFGATYDMENYSRYLIASNNTEAVALEKGNRRYVIIEADNSYANNLEYFDPIVKSIREPHTIRAFMGFLMQRDISEFNAHKIIEGNTAGDVAKINSEGAESRFWDDLLFYKPMRVFVKADGVEYIHQQKTYEAFQDYCSGIKAYEKGISRRAFWAKTRKLIPILAQKGVAKWINGEAKKLLPASLTQLRQNFTSNLEIENIEENTNSAEYFLPISEDFENDAQSEDKYDF